MIFIDGIGIGKEDKVYNPFFKYQFKTFLKHFGSIPSLKNPILKNKQAIIFPVDPIMGVKGLPLSGTGQTSIFCGVNASKIIGKHFGPYPYSTLIPIIKEKNIFKYFLNKNKKVSFANAYPKIFFDYINSGKKRLSVTSLSCLLSGMRLNRVTDVRRGCALTAGINNERWNTKLGYNLPVISPHTAARRLLRISDKNKFTLYEFFLTDHLGHGRIKDEFDNVMYLLDNFLMTILNEFDYSNKTLIICSDHGNFEDTRIKTHTLNPALTLTGGKHAFDIAENIKHLYDIKGTIIKFCE
ncbi:MAG: metalloenzyme [Bacteroidetes bacterium]|nr:metalloenzyme [Bacteroidota bacterium]